MDDHSLASFVAQKIWGPDQKIIDSTTLGGGMANQGVFLHKLSSGEEFIEKRTKRVNELVFSQMVLSQSLFKNNKFLTIPIIFDIIKKENGYCIFMESLNLLSSSDLEEKKFAFKIGNFVAELHKDFDAIRGGHNNENLNQSIHLDKLLEVFPLKYKKEYRMLCKLVEIMKQEKQIFSHNDLFIPNMGFRNDKENLLTAFDFGLAGMNTPGAELHHFLDRSPPEFFNNLLDQYCLASGLEKGLVLAGANLYSGYREFERSKSAKDIRNRFRKLKQSVILANQAIMV